MLMKHVFLFFFFWKRYMCVYMYVYSTLCSALCVAFQRFPTQRSVPIERLNLCTVADPSLNTIAPRCALLRRSPLLFSLNSLFSPIKNPLHFGYNIIAKKRRLLLSSFSDNTIFKNSYQYEYDDYAIDKFFCN